jgi:hypothetical protein
MVAHHEGFDDVHPIGKWAQHVEIGGLQRKRLFAQHVLAGLRCGQTHRHVQMVGQRVVDGLDLRIGQQRFVRAVGLRDAQCIGGCLRHIELARGDAEHLQMRAGDHCRDHLLQADRSSGHHAKTQWWVQRWLQRWVQWWVRSGGRVHSGWGGMSLR